MRNTISTRKEYPIFKMVLVAFLTFGHGAILVASQQQEEAEAPAPAPEAQELVFADERLSVVYPIIQTFKNIITSDPLNVTNSWVGSDICSYKGFYCDNPPDNTTALALASIDFNGFGLSAPSLQGFIDQLPDIALFHANSNFFTGPIPSNIANLTYLYELDLSNNLFSGSFPTALLGITNLSFLDLRFNLFSGGVPPLLFTKDELEILFINNNNFMQQLPTNLGNSHIILLTLANNKFFGPIPADIAKTLSNLTEVLLLNNLFSGCLPYQLGFLNETVVFDAGNNRLTGPIPFSLGCLANVEVLNFAGNFLYGIVPEVVCALGNLANLSLSDNYFIHVGPICRRLIRKGVLDVKKNCIPGLPFQRSLVECASFFLRPRICPHLLSFAYIPCSLPNFSSSSLRHIAPSPS